MKKENLPLTNEIVDRIRRFTKALRYGEYIQGTGSLRRKTDDGFCYCVMGVACDVVPGIQWSELAGFDDSFVSYKGSEKEVAELPWRVKEYYGFQTERGHVEQRLSLTLMNDKGLSFSDLADFIEKHLEKAADDNEFSGLFRWKYVKY